MSERRAGPGEEPPGQRMGRESTTAPDGPVDPKRHPREATQPGPEPAGEEGRGIPEKKGGKL